MRPPIAFYEDRLDLRLRMKSPHWTESDVGATKLALHGIDEERGAPPEPCADPSQKKGVATEIVFDVDDPLAARADLVRAGVIVTAPKHVHDAGPTVGVSCMFEDPDGNLLSVQGLVPGAVWAGLARAGH